MNPDKILSIYKAVEHWSEQRPAAKALTSSVGDSLSYFQLLECMRNFNDVSSEYIPRNARVAVVMEQGSQSAFVILAATHRYAVLPLNYVYCRNEYIYFLQRFKVDALLVDDIASEELQAAAEQCGVRMFKVALDKEYKIKLFSVLGANNKIAINKNQNKPCYVLPTSGTTSEPKVVLLSDYNIFHSAQNIIKFLDLNDQDICLNVMPLFHVHGLMVLAASVYAGSEVICSPKYNNNDFFAWLSRFRPTWYTASAGIQENILFYFENKIKKIKTTKLRFIRSSSAPLSPETTKKLESIFRAPIAESYGMTEAALQITSQPLPPSPKKIGSCGRAAGLSLAIMGDNNEFLGTNEDGEIAIKGKNVINEYEDNPLENDKSFYRGWFKTGDFGYIDEDGFLFIKGRKKEMINRGGEKIFPREIDEAAMGHPSVRLAVAFAAPHKTLGEDLALAVIATEGAKLTKSDLIRHMRKSLAAYKMPSVVYFVDDIPRTAVGKPKRVGLYEQITKTAAVKTDAPKEQVNDSDLALAWNEVLGQRPTPNDNFFELGGDSISGQELVHELSKRGITISYSDIQDHPVFREMLKHIKI